MGMWLTTRKLLGITFAALLVASTLLTVIDTPLSLWHRFFADDSHEGITTYEESAESTPISEYSLVPIAVPPQMALPLLPKMLDAAKSVRGSSAADNALRVVAKAAVRQRDYAIAIQAGSASPSFTASSDTLAFVALCAAHDGQFDWAVDACRRNTHNQST